MSRIQREREVKGLKVNRNCLYGKSNHTARTREVLYMSRLFCKNSFWVDGYMELRKLKKRHWSSLLRYYILCKHSFVDWEKHMLGKQKYSSLLYGKKNKKNHASYITSQHCPKMTWGILIISALIPLCSRLSFKNQL